MAERCPHSPQRGSGWLEGWRLTFGGEDIGWDGALTTVVADAPQRVFVVLYDVPELDERMLDRWDGATIGYYRKIRVRVQTLDGEALGSVPRKCVRVANVAGAEVAVVQLYDGAAVGGDGQRALVLVDLLDGAARSVLDSEQVGVPETDDTVAGGELAAVERSLARASLQAPLVALAEDAGAACADDPSPKGDRRCPRCGGVPQLSFRTDEEDPLVSGRRYLVCARCGQSWSYSASSCPSCGETSGSRRTVYAERRGEPVVRGGGEDHVATGVAPADAPTFPHLRIDACGSCERYLIDVDVARDRQAVPEVDELAAMPLDLFAAEHGLSKITPNLMGF